MYTRHPLKKIVADIKFYTSKFKQILIKKSIFL